jgi:hypothetical protein
VTTALRVAMMCICVNIRQVQIAVVPSLTGFLDTKKSGLASTLESVAAS